jgi:hypothetical protein
MEADIGSLVIAQQKLLALELEVARARFKHKGNRGADVEAAFRHFLANHLPRRYSVGTGEVISAFGDSGKQRSKQIDVIINNDAQPLIYPIDAAGLHLVEGVSFCGEIKSTISPSKFPEVFLEARAVKSMKKMLYDGGLVKRNPLSHYVKRVPYFLFAYESRGKKEDFLLQVLLFIKERRSIPLDFILLFDKGLILIVSPEPKIPGFGENGTINFEFDEDEITKVGSIKIVQTKASLAMLLAWISMFQLDSFGGFNPMGPYLQEVLNDNVEDFTFANPSRFLNEATQFDEQDYNAHVERVLQARLELNMRSNPNSRLLELFLAQIQLTKEGAL